MASWDCNTDCPLVVSVYDQPSMAEPLDSSKENMQKARNATAEERVQLDPPCLNVLSYDPPKDAETDIFQVSVSVSLS